MPMSASRGLSTEDVTLLMTGGSLPIEGAEITWQRVTSANSTPAIEDEEVAVEQVLEQFRMDSPETGTEPRGDSCCGPYCQA